MIFILLPKILIYHVLLNGLGLERGVLAERQIPPPHRRALLRKETIYPAYYAKAKAIIIMLIL